MDDLEKIFSEIAEKNLRGSAESVSGTGSTLEATEKIRRYIRWICLEYNIKSVVDSPCGDINWMKELFPFFAENGIDYLGMDIVESIITKNKSSIENHSAKDYISFSVGDITQQIPANYDLVIMRDVIGHLSTINGVVALENVKRSGAEWLLTTTFPNVCNIETNENGGCRKINLLTFPYEFNPELIINEHCKEGDGTYDNKCMALFDVSKLPLEV